MVAGVVGKEGGSVVSYQDWGTHGFLRKHSSVLHCLAPVCLLCELVCFFLMAWIAGLSPLPCAGFPYQ